MKQVRTSNDVRIRTNRIAGALSMAMALAAGLGLYSFISSFQAFFAVVALAVIGFIGVTKLSSDIENADILKKATEGSLAEKSAQVDELTSTASKLQSSHETALAEERGVAQRLREQHCKERRETGEIQEQASRDLALMTQRCDALEISISNMGFHVLQGAKMVHASKTAPDTAESEATVGRAMDSIVGQLLQQVAEGHCTDVGYIFPKDTPVEIFVAPLQSYTQHMERNGDLNSRRTKLCERLAGIMAYVASGGKTVPKRASETAAESA